ncbi:type II secretion system protein [Aeromicrobium sp. 179-A 4D2 NHS]|uniref:type II secretion system protein n=1 Tax=Aeromicrobium sp. 179-A 4D2 NHS TaxID=3142375 RepID=UPI0039A16F23
MHTPNRITLFRRRATSDRGFGIVEVLAVMVIVGLLAAVAVPQIAKWRENGYVTAMESDLRNASNAMQIAAGDEGAFPTSLNGLYRPSPDTTVTIGGGGAPTVALPEALSHLRLAGAPSSVTVKGVNISVAPEGESTLKVTVSCPSSVPNGLQSLRCRGTDGVEFVLWADASPGPAPALLCQTPAGVVQTVGQLNNSNISVRTTRADTPGYVTNGPITVVTGTSTCPSGGKAVGFSYNGANITNATYVNRRFQMAWGITAQAADSSPAPSTGLCLEATHAKTDKVRSWTPETGLRKTAC